MMQARFDCSSRDHDETEHGSACLLLFSSSFAPESRKGEDGMFALVRIIIALVLVSFTSTLSFPQNASIPEIKPKIGLVLEGGGALGLAHIGVIHWLEEHRIPVSYIAGTSMGGLVGGLYATGRSPAEVRDLVGSIQWNDV